MRPEIYRELKAALESNQLVVLATVVSDRSCGRQLLIWPRGETLGDLGAPRLNQRAALYAEQIVAGAQSGRKGFRRDEEEIDVFFEVLPPPPELILVGAVHIAIPLTTYARTLGFRTVVIDPREAFARIERFPDADEVVAQWPQQALGTIELHESSYLAVLSHDLKIDLPALEAALMSRAAYIGALGSRKTHRKRIEALKEKGFDDAAIERIRSPIGLDLGGRRAEEIALAIMAQVVAVQHGRVPLPPRSGGAG